MSTSFIILFLGFIAAVAVAAFFILQNRKLSQALKARQEPVLNLDHSSEVKEYNEDLLDEIQPEHNELDVMGEEDTEEYTQLAANKPKDKTVQQPVHPVPSPFRNDLIALYLRAKPEQPFAGYELLQALLSAGLRYGKMNIFHRYEQVNSRGSVLFSVASAAEPGTFEIPKMGGFSTPGLSIFMQASAQSDLATAFELMLDTARQLIDDLGGEIWDDQKQPLSEEKINQWRKMIAEYERSKCTEDMFSQA